jgi:hypothetical protein
MGFQGVWLADLLDAAGADDEANSLHITALDNYQVDLPFADVRGGGVLLATRTGDGGPIRSPTADPSASCSPTVSRRGPPRTSGSGA